MQVRDNAPLRWREACASKREGADAFYTANPYEVACEAVRLIKEGG